MGCSLERGLPEAPGASDEARCMRHGGGYQLQSGNIGVATDSTDQHDRIETARQHVCARVPIMDERALAGEGQQLLTSRLFDLIEIVLVVDRDGCLAGVVETRELLSRPAPTPLVELARRDWPTVTPDVDQEHAVEIAAGAHVTTLPVVDNDRKPLGCIPARALIDVMAAEHREDVHRMAGILRQNSDGREALDGPPLRRFARRMPWLLVGLALSTAGTAVMAGFEKTLSSNVAVAFFIPALVYLTDAIGTQTEAIAVRGLALTRTPFPIMLVREVMTGAAIGAALGILAVLGVWVGFGNWRLAVCVGISLFAAGSLASAVGLFLPWALGRLGIDPALGSGPVATIVQDVLTLLVYFAVLAAILPEPS